MQPLSNRGVLLLATEVSLHLAGVQVHGVRADAGQELHVVRHDHEALAPALQVVGQPQHLCTLSVLGQAHFPAQTRGPSAAGSRPATAACGGQDGWWAPAGTLGVLEQAL